MPFALFACLFYIATNIFIENIQHEAHKYYKSQYADFYQILNKEVVSLSADIWIILICLV
ncbi:hypothetical protein D1872_350020 [compost metagenome]